MLHTHSLYLSSISLLGSNLCIRRTFQSVPLELQICWLEVSHFEMGCNKILAIPESKLLDVHRHPSQVGSVGCITDHHHHRRLGTEVTQRAAIGKLKERGIMGHATSTTAGRSIYYKHSSPPGSPYTSPISFADPPRSPQILYNILKLSIYLFCSLDPWPSNPNQVRPTSLLYTK